MIIIKFACIMGKVNSIPTNPKTSVYTTASLMETTKKKWWK